MPLGMSCDPIATTEGEGEFGIVVVVDASATPPRVQTGADLIREITGIEQASSRDRPQPSRRSSARVVVGIGTGILLAQPVAPVSFCTRCRHSSSFALARALPPNCSFTWINDRHRGRSRVHQRRTTPSTLSRPACRALSRGPAPSYCYKTVLELL